MSPELAQAIIDGFKADGLCGALPKEIFTLNFSRWKWRIQSWLPSISKQCSDALWDGNDERAFQLLLKISGRHREDGLAQSRYHSAATGHADLYRSAHPSEFSEKVHPSSDWKTVKAVRSKGQHKRFKG